MFGEQTLQKNVPNTCPTFRKTTFPKKTFSDSQNISNINPATFQNFSQQFKQFPNHISRLSNTIQKLYAQKRCRKLFKTFKQYETLSTKNTVPKVQNTHPNTFPNFQNIFHCFPKHYSNVQKLSRITFQRLFKTSKTYFSKNHYKLSKAMSKQFPKQLSELPATFSWFYTLILQFFVFL